MKTCPNCGGMFEDSTAVCPIDGYDFLAAGKEAPTEPEESEARWTCPICGGTYGESVKVCPDDGYDRFAKPKKARFKGRAAMWTCPNCGGVFDNSLKLCPIDGYDRSLKRRTGGFGAVATRLRRLLKILLRVLLVLAAVAAVLVLVSALAEGNTLPTRLSRLTGGQDRLATLRERIGFSRLQHAAESRLQERFLYAMNRMGRTLSGVIGRLHS